MTYIVLHHHSLYALVLTALIVIPGCGTFSSTQNLERDSVVGHYEGKTGEGHLHYNEQLKLNDDSTFVWFRDMHMLRLESFGTWDISSNQVILQSHESIKDPKIYIFEKWTEQADSVIFHIEDEKGEPIPYIAISTGNKQEHVSNIHGETHIQKNDFVSPVEIKAAFTESLILEDHFLTHNRFIVRISYSHTDTNISFNEKKLLYRKHKVSRKPYLQWQDGNIKLEKANP